MDFGNITNAAQDLVKKAQDIANSNPELVKRAEEISGLDLDQNGSVGGDAVQQTQTITENSDVTDVIPVADTDIDAIDNSVNEPMVNNNSEEGIMHEKLPELADDEEVVE
jgi:hypothetical protein